jgi:hypothetical protein
MNAYGTFVIFGSLVVLAIVGAACLVARVLWWISEKQ